MSRKIVGRRDPEVPDSNPYPVEPHDLEILAGEDGHPTEWTCSCGLTGSIDASRA